MRNSRGTCARRSGISAVEVAIAGAVLLVGTAVALPWVQSMRESARKAACRNNMKAIGLALHGYEQVHRRFPSGGKGTAWKPRSPDVPPLEIDVTVNPSIEPNGTVFHPQSTFTLLLPHLANAPRDSAGALDRQYNAADDSPASRTNREIARTRMADLLCPGNPIKTEDPAGYGQTDYAPTVFTDVVIVENPLRRVPVGKRDPATPADRGARFDGMLSLPPTPMGWITDGTSNTMAVAECAGRQLLWSLGGVRSVARAPDGTRDTCGGTVGSESSGFRCPNRWADPDNALGVSGSPVEGVRLIQNHAKPVGGPAECPWTTPDCGPNDELFGFHEGGIVAVFGDGAARFISHNIQRDVLIKLVARNDGETIDLPSCESESRGKSAAGPVDDPSAATQPSEAVASRGGE